MLGVAATGPLGPPREVRTATREAPDQAATYADRMEREAWAILAGAAGLGPATFANLVGAIGSARTVLDLALEGPGALTHGLASAVGGPPAPLLTPEVEEAIAQQARAPGPTLAALHRLELQVLLIGDPDYPPRLLAIEMPPPVLFVQGDPGALDPPHAVAVVGTRAPTDAGRALAMSLATKIGAAGATIVSGLAIGIDGAAHAAAVEHGHGTIGVLGGGHDHLYPRAHRSLAVAIVADGGAIVSEMAPLERPTRWSFPRRNRIISGLSDATVVIQAPLKSGALDTARWAMEQGRDCFLVPGRPGDHATEGSLNLMREYPGQARVVASVAGLLEDLQLTQRPARARSGAREPVDLDTLDLSTIELRLAELIRTGGATLDEIVASTSLPVATALGALTLLEMRDLVGSAYGRYRPTARLAGARASGRRARAAAGRRRPARDGR